jgi:outer membrane protein assembly factor BamD
VVTRIHAPRPGIRVGALALAALVLLSGCTFLGGFFGGRPSTLPPAATLYEDGERALLREKYDAAREALAKIVERHPDSDLVPQARLLIGESYYREQEYDRAVREFEQFMTLFPGHPIADLAQYRLARSHFDQMPTLERDQAITAKALTEFRKLIKQYPESRYAPDAIAKIEACRLRLAQKELWVAAYYVRQGKLEAALQRYDVVLKDYGRTTAFPQALFEKADILVRLGRTDEATSALRRLVEEHPGSEWSRRARQRHAQLL